MKVPQPYQENGTSIASDLPQAINIRRRDDKRPSQYGYQVAAFVIEILYNASIQVSNRVTEYTSPAHPSYHPSTAPTPTIA